MAGQSTVNNNQEYPYGHNQRNRTGSKCLTDYRLPDPQQKIQRKEDLSQDREAGTGDSQTHGLSAKPPGRRLEESRQSVRPPDPDLLGFRFPYPDNDPFLPRHRGQHRNQSPAFRGSAAVVPGRTA